MPLREAHAYCAKEVRQFDYDRYLATLFAPSDRRGALIALYAFNLEIAKVREVVSEPLIGRMRLQWWRERMDDIFAGNPPRHEVAVALSSAVTGHKLARRQFDRLLDARETDMTDQPPADMEALEAYVDGTSSALVRLSLEILDGSNEALARSAGQAWGLTGLIRAIPSHAAARRLFLPADKLAARGIVPEDVFARRQTKAISGVVCELAATVGTHLGRARVEARRTPAGLAALLPLALIEGYLRRLRRQSYDVFGADLEPSRLARQLRMGLAALHKRF